MSSLPIDIPVGFKVNVKEGDEVNVGDILAEKESDEPETFRVNISKLLNTKISKVPKTLKKSPGDLIPQGDTLASRTGLFWQNDIISNCNATLIAYDRETGEAFMEKTSTTYDNTPFKQVISPIKGKIRSVDDNKVVIDAKTKQAITEKIIGGTISGKLILVQPEEEDGVIKGTDITGKVIGNVMMGESFELEAFAKAAGIGVIGIVTCSLEENVIEYLTQKKMLMPIAQVDLKTYKELLGSVNKSVQIDSESNTVHVIEK